MPAPILCTTDDDASLARLEAAVARVEASEVDVPIGLDLEGVDLGRAPGTIEVVALAVGDDVFLLDAHGCAAHDAHVELLRRLVALPRCVSIIHDCRQDADALWHHWEVCPGRVYDTQCGHAALSGRRDDAANLNDALTRCGIAPNEARERVDYRRNHAHWATRPLTEAMVAHASGDVASLRTLYEAQRSEGADEAKVLAASRAQASLLRDMGATWLRCDVHMGKFIGRGGATVRRHERETGCVFYGKGGEAERTSGFMVYYPSEAALARAKRALGHGA